MKILAVHETTLLGKVTFVFRRGVVVCPAGSLVVGRSFLGRHLGAAVAALRHAEVVLVIAFCHATTGACVVGAVATHYTFVGVVDSVLTG